MNKDFYLFMWLTMGIIIYIWTLGKRNKSIQKRNFQAFLGFSKGSSGGH